MIKWSTAALFQFHKGTIRTFIRKELIIFQSYFNSIKVQLEHTLLLFYPSKALNFNSIKVQLELTDAEKLAIANYISIP